MFPEAAESVELHSTSSVGEPEAAPAGEHGTQRGAQHGQPRRRNQRFRFVSSQRQIPRVKNLYF